MSQATLSPHVRGKRDRRRAEILRAALDAFRTRGYGRTTLDDIADRVGVGKTALYHYFPDKESILYECHRRSLAEILRHVREARRSGGSAAARLTRALREHVRVMTDAVDGSPLALEVPAFSSPRRDRIVAQRDRYERELRSLIIEGIERGEFRPVDPRIAVFATLGAINWIARWYRPEGSLPPAELGKAFAEFLVGGLSCH